MPISNTDLEKVIPGDIIYLNGTIFTGRIGFYNKFLVNGDTFPDNNLFQRSNTTFHCSPAGTVVGGKPQVYSMTGTASFRFAKYMDSLFKTCRTKIVIGKGGMSDEIYKNTFRKHHAIYLSTMGYGLGALYGKSIKRVTNLFWADDLGLAQAVWELEVENFGPLLVDCDITGSGFLSSESEKINNLLIKEITSYKQPQLKRFGEITNYKDEIIS